VQAHQRDKLVQALAHNHRPTNGEGVKGQLIHLAILHRRQGFPERMVLQFRRFIRITDVEQHVVSVVK
jgi:hypothetical protein